MAVSSTNLQDGLDLRWCRLHRQVFAHAVLVTDGVVRGHTGGDNLKLGQLSDCWMSSRR